jgi:hypothetical protein
VPPWRENWDPRFTVNPLPAFYAADAATTSTGITPSGPSARSTIRTIPTSRPSPACRVARTADLDSTGPYDLTTGNPVPEAKNIRRMSDEYNPVVVLDMHHQGTRVHDGQMVTASTLYPTAIQTAQRLLAVDPNAVDRFNAGQTMAKRVVVLIAQTLAQYPYADLSRYPGGTEPGISRNAYGLLGAGSVLLELRGGLGTKSGGYIQKIGFHASLAIVREMAKDPTLAAFPAGAGRRARRCRPTVSGRAQARAKRSPTATCRGWPRSRRPAPGQLSVGCLVQAGGRALAAACLGIHTAGRIHCRSWPVRREATAPRTGCAREPGGRSEWRFRTGTDSPAAAVSLKEPQNMPITGSTRVFFILGRPGCAGACPRGLQPPCSSATASTRCWCR